MCQRLTANEVQLHDDETCLYCGLDLHAGSPAIHSPSLDSFFCDDNCLIEYRAFAASEPVLAQVDEDEYQVARGRRLALA